jgi:WD40 repeat protein
MPIRVKSKLFLVVKIYFIAALPWLLTATAPSEERQYNLHLIHRIVAHGDEFNAVKMSADGKRLFIGTEKGGILVWSIPENHIVQRLNQGSPVHALVLLANDKEILASGGNHFADLKSAVIRKWNLENGAFEEWSGMADDCVNIRQSRTKDQNRIAPDEMRSDKRWTADLCDGV